MAPQLFGSLIDSTRERRAPLRFVALQIAVAVHVFALGAVLAENWLDVPVIHEPPQNVVLVQYSTPTPEEETDKPERKVPGKIEGEKGGKTEDPDPDPNPRLEPPVVPDTTYVGPIAEGDSITSDPNGPGDIVQPNPGPEPHDVVIRIKSPLPPEVLLDVRPDYPPLAEASNVEGIVILNVVILRDGTVGEITVLRGRPMGLTEAAVEAVWRRRYKPPTTEDGEPAEIETTIGINFSL